MKWPHLRHYHPRKKRSHYGGVGDDEEKNAVSANNNNIQDTEKQMELENQKQMELEKKFKAELDQQEREMRNGAPDNENKTGPGITTQKPPPLIATRNGGIQYAIAISIFLLGILLIVLSWAIPSMTTQNSIVFTVIGVLVLLLGMMHIIAIPTMFAA